MKKIKIAALQLEAHDLTQAKTALERALALIDRAAEQYLPDLMLLPECTYPAYVLGSAKEFKANYPGDPIPALAEKAKAYNCHICVGLATPANAMNPTTVEENPDEPLIYNEAVLIGPDGEVIGRNAKSLLWHFDSKWFCAGRKYPVFETELGRIGLLVCADGREPEIARELALNGAQIILDATAWVTYGSADRTALTNPQADFMLPTRSFENNVVFVAADKVGLERGSVLYAGRSCIIDAQGQKLASGSSYQEEIVFAEVEVPEIIARPANRRPELYGLLTTPHEETPLHAVLQEAIVPHQNTLRAAVAQYLPFDTTEAMGETVRGLVKQLGYEQADLVVLPDVPTNMVEEQAWQGERVFPFYRSLSKLGNIAILATAIETEGSRRYKTAKLFSNGQEIGTWRQTHFSLQDEAGWTAGAEIGPVVTLPGSSQARIGVMLGADGYLPEVARCLMLGGADLILWPTRPMLPADFDFVKLARTRAAENRTWLLIATALQQNNSLDNGGWRGNSMILEPGGAISAVALKDTPMTVSTQIFVASARQKLVAPNTNAVYDRQPSSYLKLGEI